MIAVTLPAHNEEQLIAACLQSLKVAAQHPALRDEQVVIVVALDRCSDATGWICERFGVEVITVDAGCVGVARAAASERALALGARWIGCTDADSVVPPDWLARQLQCGASAFCGVVAVGDWLDYPQAVREQFLQGEHAVDGHPHVHGANMGFSAVAYRQCGGFAPLATGEDVALIQAMHGAGMQVARLASPRVMTSARRHARAPHGFSEFLRRLEQRVGLATDEVVVRDAAPLSLLAR
ncbi:MULTISPECIES: glycosyltransferase [unclassified Stenotrophomonas]|uniref:glycosyltransferase n=1 Tax=unclassified Stenotrophomonas TaxID=196198 RepID=UPI00089E012A|nr:MULTISPECIES: glycosyltransferase [unclassified Stenotrophomonas]AOX63919.1 glycosyl transferase [Stenotrophomonas sp. LM091]